MADLIDQGTWSGRFAAHVARRVRDLRDERGMSAQKLSDACTELGHPIHRSVLANLENGRRGTLDVCELFVIARALGVAPAALLVGGDDVEIGDGVSMSRESAVAWIAGLPDPDAVSEAMDECVRAQNEADQARKRLEAASQRLRGLLGSEPDWRRTR